MDRWIHDEQFMALFESYANLSTREAAERLSSKGYNISHSSVARLRRPSVPEPATPQQPTDLLQRLDNLEQQLHQLQQREQRLALALEQAAQILSKPKAKPARIPVADLTLVFSVVVVIVWLIRLTPVP